MVAVSASVFSKCRVPAKTLAKVIYIEDVLSSVPGTQFQWGHTHTHPIMPSNLCHKCLELSFSFILLKVFFTALYHLMLPSPLPGHVTRSTSETGGGRDDICLGRVCPGADEIGSKLADGMHHIYLYLYMGYIYIHV